MEEMELQRQRQLEHQNWMMQPAPSRPTAAERDFKSMSTQQLEEEFARRGLQAPGSNEKKKHKNKMPIRDQMIDTLCQAAEIDAVEDAGAVGAPADDSIAIQSAMNAMRDGQVLRFPPGRYMVQHLVLPHSVNIMLAGPEQDINTKKGGHLKSASSNVSTAVLELIPGGRFIFSTAALPVISDEPDKPKEEKKQTVEEQIAEAKKVERRRELAAAGKLDEDSSEEEVDDTDSVCGGSEMRPGIEVVPGDGSTIDNRPVAADSVLRKRVRLKNLTLEGPPIDKPAFEPNIGGVKCEDTAMHKQAWQLKRDWLNKGGGNTAYPEDKVNGSKLSSGESSQNPS